MSDEDTATGDPPSDEGGSPDPSPAETPLGAEGAKTDAEAKAKSKTSATKNEKKQENPLLNVMVNVLIPVVALTMLSKSPDTPDAKLWHIGPHMAMLIAVAFPLCYGLYDLITRRKVNFFSVLGLVSVLLTGGLTIHLWRPDGTVADNAAMLFGIKEALIPIIFGVMILGSHWTKTPLVRVFLYTPELFDHPRIEKKVKENGHMPLYNKLVFQTTLIMTASFFISAVANYFLAQAFLGDADTLEKYNLGVGKLTGWGFLVIGAPCVILWMGALFRLIKHIKTMTGLDNDGIMVPH